MEIAAIIGISIIVLAIVLVLTILAYNQMLLLNEVNKRLLLLAKDAYEKERTTQEELQDALITIEQMSNEQPAVHTNLPESTDNFNDSDLDI